MSLEIWQEETLQQKSKIENIKINSYSIPKNKIRVASQKMNQSNENLKENGEKYDPVLYQLIKLANEKLNRINENKIMRNFKTKIELYAIFLKVGEIENIRQRFQADAYIEATWEDNTIQGDKFDPDKYWTPDLFIENTVGNIKQEIKYKIIKRNNKTFVCEMRNIKGVFYETLELYDFPLDIQDISITVTTSKSNKEIEFECSNENESSVNTDDFRMQQEWTLYTFVNANKKEFHDIFRNYDRPALSFSGQISRRPGYFLNNAYLLVFLITCLGFVPFAFTVTSPSTRISQTVMLILSSINFKIAVTTRLPTVSYLTILDKYLLTALVFMALLCVYHSIIGSLLFSSNSNLIFYDNIFLCVFGGLFIFFHIIYIIYFIIKLLKHKKVENDFKKLVELNNEIWGQESYRLKTSSPISANSVSPLIR